MRDEVDDDELQVIVDSDADIELAAKRTGKMMMYAFV